MKIYLLAGCLTLYAPVYSQIDNTLTPREEALGWELLFDGTYSSLDNFTQWGRDNPDNDRDIASWGWGIKEGFLTILNGQGTGIRTDKKWGDFVVTMEYKTNGENGFNYRATLCGSTIWWSSIEYKITTDTSNLNWWSTPGAAFSLFEPSENNGKGAGEMNSLAVVAIGPHVEHWHNGVKVLEFEFWSQEFLDNYNMFWRDRGADTKCFARPYEAGGEPDTIGYVTEGYFGTAADDGGELAIKNFKVLENPVIGCMDSTQAEYNPQATWDPPVSLCGSTPVVPEQFSPVSIFSISIDKRSVKIKATDGGSFGLRVLDIKGKLIHASHGVAGKLTFQAPENGIYFITLYHDGRTAHYRIPIF